MSESGIIDVYILLGPSAFDVFNQYSRLTGMMVPDCKQVNKQIVDQDTLMFSACSQHYCGPEYN